MVTGMLTATPQMAGSRDHAARVGLTRDEVMTAPEVAELLHLPVSTIYYLARRASCRRAGSGGVAVPASADRAVAGGAGAGGDAEMTLVNRPDGWGPSHQTEPRRRWIARPPVLLFALAIGMIA